MNKFQLPRLSFRQKAITSAHTLNKTSLNTQIRSLKEIATENRQSQHVWLSLRLTTKNAPEESLTEIETNKEYILTLIASSTPSTFHDRAYQQGLPLAPTIELQIQCIAGSDLFLNEYVSITDNELLQLHRNFPVTIPEEVHDQKLDLKIRFKKPDERFQILGIQTIDVPQGYTPLKGQFCKIYNIAYNPPPEIAVFIVQPDHSLDYNQGMTINGKNAYQELPKETYETETIANITELMKCYTDATNIRGHIRGFSENMPSTIKQWFKTLHEKYREKLCLIIIDQSRLETPWEMIELEDYVYIGTIARVVRWTVHQQTTALPLSYEPIIHKGSVIYYLDLQNKNIHCEKEKQTLANLQHKEYETLEKLEQRLHGSLEEVGLIYVGCHGAEGRYLQQQHPDSLTANRLILIDPHPEARPIAFFNACGSARIVRDDPYNNSSFVRTMLHRFVQGYIGTLANIGGEEASSIAQQIFAMSINDSEKSIAEILRQLRQQAVDEIRQYAQQPWSKRERIDKKFLYTFMYVYYGNPQARLQLIPQQIEEEEASCQNI